MRLMLPSRDHQLSFFLAILKYIKVRQSLTGQSGPVNDLSLLQEPSVTK